MFSLMELVFWFATFSCTLAVWLCIHRLIERNSEDPKTWPILGSYPEVSQNLHRLHDWILQYFTHNHRTVKLTIFSKTCIMTVDPANVEYILNTNFQNYPKGESARTRLYDMLGDGILNVDGDMWKTHRKLASTEFSSKKLREYSATAFRSCALRLALTLRHKSRKSSSTGLPFIADLHELFMRMTLTSICKVGFGAEMDSLSSTLHGIPFGRAFDSVNELVTRRFVTPLWRLQRYFKVGTELELQQHLHHVNSFTASLVHTRRAELELAALNQHTVRELSSSSPEGSDLLSRYIAHKGRSQAGVDGQNDKELCDAILSFVIAGRDTTAVTLSWFIFCICNNPRVADKIYDEITAVLDDSSSCKNKEQVDDDEDMLHFASLLSYNSLSKMHYLHAALTETLRLYPAVPRDGKVAVKDDVLPDGTRVRAGEQVAYIPYSMGRMQFIWGQDASLFRPERWLRDNDGTFQPQSSYKFTAFQAGPRICLGRDYAYLQMKMSAALLIRFFRFQLVAKEEVKYRILMVLAMANGLKVQVTERSCYQT